MKRIVMMAIVAILVLSVGLVAFADSGVETPQWYNDMLEWRRAQGREIENSQWYKDMLKWREEQVNQAVKNGEITEEQARYWKEQMELMEKYQDENGYGFGYGHHGMMGRGMMGRFGKNLGERFGGNRFMGGFGGFGPGACHRW